MLAAAVVFALAPSFVCEQTCSFSMWSLLIFVPLTSRNVKFGQFSFEQTTCMKLVQLNFNPWFQITGNIHVGRYIHTLYFNSNYQSSSIELITWERKVHKFLLSDASKSICSSKQSLGSYYWEYCYSVQLQEVFMLVSANTSAWREVLLT